MKCIAVIREVSNYIDGDLDAALRLEIERHLEICKNCLLVVNQTKLTIEIYCAEEAAELPGEMKTRLREALQRKFGESRS